MPCNFRRKIVSVVFLACTLSSARGAAILLGLNGTAPIQQVSLSGSTTGTFGPDNASAAVVDDGNHVFVVIPGLSSSTISSYDSMQNLLGSFTFDAGIDNGNGPANYISDIAFGGSTLWLAAYNGMIYGVSTAGSVLNSFDTGMTRTGVATDGTYLYTTSGAGFDSAAPLIYRRNLSGTVLGTINTGLNDTLGIGYNTADASFWIGGFDMLAHVDGSGSILNTYDIAGVQSGVEVGDLNAAPPPPSEVPEPSSFAMFAGAAAALLLARQKSLRRFLPMAAIAGVVAMQAHGAVSIQSIQGYHSPLALGSNTQFIIVPVDNDPGTLRYRFEERAPGATSFSMIRDYGPFHILSWVPMDKEGTYEIRATVRNINTGTTASQIVPLTVTSRVAGGTPVVSTTSHPLVALYSAPACPAGSTMRVRFKRAADVQWKTTPMKNCNGATSMNFYVAGMLATSTYSMRHDVINGPFVATGPALSFTTGAIGVNLPTTAPIIPTKSPTSTTDGTYVFGTIQSGSGIPPYATDADGNPIWYYSGTVNYLTRVVPGGNMIGNLGYSRDYANSGFREFDLVGQTIKETNIERINEQLPPGKLINVIHHEARRLPNGDYLLLAMTDKMSDAQGPMTDIASDAIVVLDNNLQLKWFWDAFDHLDVTRAAVLHETCIYAVNACVLRLADTANDWLHGNSLQLTPDGNILYSARHQDWVIKIAYNNGTGDGHVIWRLGKDGDFTWLSNDPWPWQSHQHDPEYESNNVISVFDNGNTRVMAQGGGHSRGQVLQIDETNRTVTPLLNVDTGVYAFAVGSVNRLSNGNHIFDNGFAPNGSQVVESDPNGNIVSNMGVSVSTYRAFRMRDLYTAPW